MDRGRERAEPVHGWQRYGAEELRDKLGKRVIWLAVVAKNLLFEETLGLQPFQ